MVGRVVIVVGGRYCGGRGHYCRRVIIVVVGVVIVVGGSYCGGRGLLLWW